MYVETDREREEERRKEGENRETGVRIVERGEFQQLSLTST
jgi:hypothetical protein